MIGLLDPAFLLPRAAQADEKQLVDELDLIAIMCRRNNIAIPPFEEYWPELWNTLGRDLERSLSHPDAKAALRQLRQLGDASGDKIRGDAPDGAVWRRGFTDLFSWNPLNSEWERRMAEAAVRAATIPHERVILLARRIVGRNVRRHTVNNTEILENTRWQLHIQPRVVGPRRIACVHHPRNLTEKWTTRFDWRLPASSDGARYPFCPPDRWWNHSEKTVRTISSKPAWVDVNGNGWSRPSIAGGVGYHWDVHVRVLAISQTIGMDQINVVEFGAPQSEGQPGDLHHVPSRKTARIKDTGWSCP